MYVDVSTNDLMCNNFVFGGFLSENFSCIVHMVLYLYDKFHILQSFWLILDPGKAM
jgi:hypothetical protein